MPTEKISATLDRDVLEEIRRSAGPRQVSSFLSEAAREKLQRTRILAYLDRLDVEFGEPEERERRTASRLVRKVLR